MNTQPRHVFGLLFVWTISLSLVACNASSSTKAEQSDPISPASTIDKPKNDAGVNTKPDKVVVYYFHGDRRCKTCLGIQSAIQQTIKERFADETANGLVEFLEVNIDQEENKPFVKEFELSFSTLVVAAKDGSNTVKWENCQQVWEHAHNHPILMDYAEARIRAYLDLMKGQ